MYRALYRKWRPQRFEDVVAQRGIVTALRNQVAVVLQKNVLFSGTIKENLRWGTPDATDDELVEACKLAQADEFVQSFPQKYDTYIEQGGANVSGGQKQRVAIASAIASKRSILFFDEPTSGLDYKHMKEVANVLRQVRDTGITVYVITHDLELILDCCTDIVHFENGSIIDQFQMDEAGLEKIRNYFIKGVSVK